MEMRRICDKKYLLVPVAPGQPPKLLEIFAGGNKIYEFWVPESEEKGAYRFRYYAPLPLERYAGKLLSLKGEFGSAFLEAVRFSDSVPDKSPCRPFVHFTADAGWINDPNGFFYHDGIYHLYFQHNPMDTRWGNMSWGHAVSKDLLHWEQREDVMYPDEDGTIFSGCALRNEEDLPGLPTGCPFFFYTSAGGTSPWSEGKAFVQKIACSPDGGNSFQKTGITAVPHIAGENRDPKVYRHEESGAYFMVLYLEENEFAVLRSENLTNWTVTQRLVLEDAWECPDLIRVPVEGGGSRWVFWCADGFYFVGDFDGRTFMRTGGKMRAYASCLPYAAQTCWGEERVVSVPWLRSGNEQEPYTGVMGIPRELTLAEKKGVLRLRQRPVRELAKCRKKVEAYAWKGSVALYRCDASRAAETVIFLQEKGRFEAILGQVNVCFDPGSSRLRVSGCLEQKGEKDWRREEETRTEGKICIKEVRLEEVPRKVSLLADHEILEITLDDGFVCAAFEIPYEKGCGTLRIAVDAQGTHEVYEI